MLAHVHLAGVLPCSTIAAEYSWAVSVLSSVSGHIVSGSCLLADPPALAGAQPECLRADHPRALTALGPLSAPASLPLAGWCGILRTPVLVSQTMPMPQPRGHASDVGPCCRNGRWSYAAVAAVRVVSNDSSMAVTAEETRGCQEDRPASASVRILFIPCGLQSMCCVCVCVTCHFGLEVKLLPLRGCFSLRYSVSGTRE